VDKRLLTGVVLGLLTAIVAVVLLWSVEKPHGSETPREKNTVYVALGDSVASGLGLANPGDNSGCGRTKEAYPYRLATRMDYELIHLACTGATLKAGINGPQVVAGEVTSQREQLFRKEPGLITFGIGANDVAWLSLAARCLEVTCGTEADKVAYERLLGETFKPQLRETLEAIGKRYGDQAKLLVIGYYQVFPPAGTNCADTGGLDNRGLSWARELRARLNRVVADTVRETGTGTYVEIDFSGHELCTSEPWVQGLADPAPYHANIAGQAAIARQIEEELREGR
jgi:lysophospholipase L1-like esterase